MSEKRRSTPEGDGELSNTRDEYSLAQKAEEPLVQADKVETREGTSTKEVAWETPTLHQGSKFQKIAWEIAISIKFGREVNWASRREEEAYSSRRRVGRVEAALRGIVERLARTLSRLLVLPLLRLALTSEQRAKLDSYKKPAE